MSTSTDNVTEPLVKKELDEQDKWIENLDLEGFKSEIQLLGKQLQEGQGEDDMRHLSKMMWWGRILTFMGIATLWVFPNPFTVVCLSLATFSRWTMIGHHVCHGGYDRADKSGRFNRFKFAVGGVYNRLMDWFDWMLPEAWNVEHNQLHHYHLNEDKDPDLVEENLLYLRDLNIPKFLKYVVVGFFVFTWKWFYYAPNTYQQLKIAQMRRNGLKTDHIPRAHFTLASIFEAPDWVSVTELFSVVLLPYFVWRFMVIPLPFFFVMGPVAYKYAIINLVLAELLTNAHAFLAIVTNHAGDDLYRFAKHCKPRGGHFYLRQVIGSADFATGSDVVDFFHGWLNYQIEHHLWPDLSMLSYQRSQPKVKAICEKYGIPYVQQSVWWRLKKTVDIMVGNTDMRQYPIEYEPTDYDSKQPAVQVVETEKADKQD